MSEAEKKFRADMFPAPPNRFGINICAGGRWSYREGKSFITAALLRDRVRVEIEISDPTGEIFNFGEIFARIWKFQRPIGTSEIDWIEFKILLEGEVKELVEGGKYKIVQVFEAPKFAS
ncbi:MAG: hypothetical protein WCV72_01120 [Patescibacteria group bacterium]